MGIDYSAAIVVGLPASEFDENFINDLDENYAWGESLDRIPPYYDAPTEDCIIGYYYLYSGDYSARAIALGDLAKLEELKARFRTETGYEPEVWITPVGS